MDLLSDSREIIRNEVVQNKCSPLCNKLYGIFLSLSNIILFLFALVVAREGGKRGEWFIISFTMYLQLNLILLISWPLQPK